MKKIIFILSFIPFCIFAASPFAGHWKGQVNDSGYIDTVNAYILSNGFFSGTTMLDGRAAISLKGNVKKNGQFAFVTSQGCHEYGIITLKSTVKMALVGRLSCSDGYKGSFSGRLTKQK